MVDDGRQIKAGVVLSYATLALNNIIALVYTPFMLRMMGQSEYGLYSLVASVVAYLTIMDFGFGNAIVRYTAKYNAEGRRKEQYSLFGMFLSIYIAIGILSLTAGAWLYFNVEELFGTTMSATELSEARVMVLLMVANIALTFPLSLFPSVIMAYENFVFHKAVNIIRIFLQPCIMLPLLFFGYKAVAMVVVTTALNLLTQAVYCWYCFSRLHIRISFSSFDKTLLREISTYSFYVFLTIIVDRAFWSTGQFILGVLSGTEDVAVYSLVVQICNYYMSFSLAISGVFLPKITHYVATGRAMSEISDMFVRIGRLQFMVLGYILSGFILFGRPFIHYWAGAGYEMVYPLAVLLMIPQTVPLIQNLGISILQAQNRQMFRSFLNVTVALISVFVGYRLTKAYGITGCAAATAMALAVGHGVILNWYYCTRIKIDILSFWRQIVRLALLFAISSAVTWIVIKTVGGGYSIPCLAGEGLLFSVVAYLLLWRFGCNDFERKYMEYPIRKLKEKLCIQC